MDAEEKTYIFLPPRRWIINNFLISLAAAAFIYTYSLDAPLIIRIIFSSPALLFALIFIPVLWWSLREPVIVTDSYVEYSPWRKQMNGLFRICMKDIAYAHIVGSKKRPTPRIKLKSGDYAEEVFWLPGVFDNGSAHGLAELINENCGYPNPDTIQPILKGLHKYIYAITFLVLSLIVLKHMGLITQRYLMPPNVEEAVVRDPALWRLDSFGEERDIFGHADYRLGVKRDDQFVFVTLPNHLPDSYWIEILGSDKAKGSQLSIQWNSNGVVTYLSMPYEKVWRREITPGQVWGKYRKEIWDRVSVVFLIAVMLVGIKSGYSVFFSGDRIPMPVANA
jgi:hypothetical protein